MQSKLCGKSALPPCTARHARRIPHRARAAEPREVGVLGGQDFIYSQRSGVEDELFKGKGLGIDADIAQAGFRQTQLNTLEVGPPALGAPG